MLTYPESMSEEEHKLAESINYRLGAIENYVDTRKKFENRLIAVLLTTGLTALLGGAYTAGTTLNRQAALFDDVEDINQEIATIAKRVEHNTASIKEKEFTQANFDRQIKPLVDLLDNKISALVQSFNRFENRLESIEQEVKNK